MGFSVPGQPQNTAPRGAPVATSRAGGYAAPTTRQQEAALATVAPSEPVKYEAGGEEIELSPELIKAYLVNGDADKVTDQEVMMYLNLCRFNHLNPWLKEVYLIKYGDKPATMVPGKESFMKRAERNQHFAGIESGIVVHNSNNNQIEYREGSAVYLRLYQFWSGPWLGIYPGGPHEPYRHDDRSVCPCLCSTTTRTTTTLPSTFCRLLVLSKLRRMKTP